MARGGGRAQLAPIPCPDCRGPMYDNIADKAAGRRGHKAPDYACKDREGCNKGVWLKDSEKNALQAGSRGGTGQGSAQAKRPIVIDSLMDSCVAAAKAITAEQFKDKAVTLELVVNMATTMFIARAGGAPGILKIEKEGLAKAQAKAAEAAARKRKQEEEEEARRRQDAEAEQEGYDPGTYPGDDDDNPF